MLLQRRVDMCYRGKGNKGASRENHTYKTLPLHEQENNFYMRPNTMATCSR